eukprot:scaffold60253_cov29-Attheya_sp.AAC.2
METIFANELIVVDYASQWLCGSVYCIKPSLGCELFTRAFRKNGQVWATFFRTRLWPKGLGEQNLDQTVASLGSVVNVNFTGPNG